VGIYLLGSCLLVVDICLILSKNINYIIKDVRLDVFTVFIYIRVYETIS